MSLSKLADLSAKQRAMYNAIAFLENRDPKYPWGLAYDSFDLDETYTLVRTPSRYFIKNRKTEQSPRWVAADSKCLWSKLTGKYLELCGM